MSLAISTRRNDYVGNGLTTEFSYTWRLITEQSIKVVVKDLDDVETILTLGDDYTVGSILSQTGGNITLVDDGQDWIDAVDGGLKEDFTISLIGNTSLNQLTDIRNQGSYYPALHEDAFDKLTMIAQEQEQKLSGCVKLPDSIYPDDFNVKLPSDTNSATDKILSVNDSGDGFTWRTIADLLSVIGSLVASNNLSDLVSPSAAVANLGISPLSSQTSHNVTDGQAATDLTGITFDGASRSSAVMEVEIIRGTTVFANVRLAMQYINATWRVVVGASISEEPHGVTFSVSQSTTVGQLRAALDTGAGNGTIKIKTHTFS